METSILILLRWLIGAGCAAGLGVYLLILTAGKGMDAFRGGAGSEGTARQLLAVGIPLLLAAMLVSAVTPRPRWFSHLVAAGVACAAGLVCWDVLPGHPREGAIYLSFFVLWIVYYALGFSRG